MNRFLIEKTKEGYFVSDKGVIIYWTSKKTKFFKWLEKNL